MIFIRSIIDKYLKTNSINLYDINIQIISYSILCISLCISLIVIKNTIDLQINKYKKFQETILRIDENIKELNETKKEVINLIQKISRLGIRIGETDEELNEIIVRNIKTKEW